jgi:hypothetical protein
MLQIVRRRPESTFSLRRAELVVSGKERRLEFAFVSLASTNLFVIASAVAFYFLTYKS